MFLPTTTRTMTCCGRRWAWASAQRSARAAWVSARRG